MTQWLFSVYRVLVLGGGGVGGAGGVHNVSFILLFQVLLTEAVFISRDLILL